MAKSVRPFGREAKGGGVVVRADAQSSEQAMGAGVQHGRRVAPYRDSSAVGAEVDIAGL